MTVEVRRGTTRFITRSEGYRTWHSFSFGEHYDADNLGFGPIVCHDDHLLRSGAGFGEHRHEDLEIVSWVMSGAVRHTASVGPATVVPAGQVQVLSAGSGVQHREVADQAAGPTRFVQTWLRPDAAGTEPAYATADTTDVISPGRLVPVVSGHDPAALVSVGTASATLHAATLEAGQSVTLPDDPLQHVFVATGSLVRSSLAQPLSAGDAFRITDRPGLSVTAASRTELLVWSFV